MGELNDYFNNNLSGFGFGGGSSPTPAPPPSQVTPPDVTQAQNTGGALDSTPPPAPPPPPTNQGNAGLALGNSAQPGAAPQQMAPPPAAPVPLALYNRPPTEQAATLAAWVAGQGVKMAPFAVGGTSSVDQQINEAIDRVNNPNTPASEMPSLAHLISDLSSLRARELNSQMPGVFTYDTQTGTIKGGVAVSPETLVGNLGHTTPVTAPTMNNTNSDQSRGMLLNQIAALQNTGTAADNESRLRTSALVSGIEDQNSTRKQELADRLGSAGIQGGRAESLLNAQNMEAGRERASGLNTIQTSIFDKQYQSKKDALTAMLQLNGMDAQQAQFQATQMLQADLANQGNDTQRLISQAGLAQGQSQFDSTLGFNTEQANANNLFNTQQLNNNTSIQQQQLALQQRQQDMTLLMQLIVAAMNGDNSNNDRLQQLLLTLGAQ